MRINEGKFTIIIIYFFVISGIVYGIVGLYYCSRSITANSSWVETQAQITDIQRHGKSKKVTIRYQYTNATFDNHTNFHNKSDRIGDSVRIKVNPEDPMDITFPDTDFILIIILLVLCAVFTGGGGFIIHKLKQKSLPSSSTPSI